MDSLGGTEADVEARINKARFASMQLKPVWFSSTITRHMKIRIFYSNVKSVLLYKCETWLVKKVVTARLQVFIDKSTPRTGYIVATNNLLYKTVGVN